MEKITCEKNGSFRLTIPKHMLVNMEWLKDTKTKTDIDVIVEAIPPLGKIIIQSIDSHILSYLVFLENMANQKGVKNKEIETKKIKQSEKRFKTYSKKDISFLFKIPPHWKHTKNQISRLDRTEKRKILISKTQEKKEYIEKLKSILQREERDLKLMERYTKRLKPKAKK